MNFSIKEIVKNSHLLVFKNINKLVLPLCFIALVLYGYEFIRGTQLVVNFFSNLDDYNLFIELAYVCLYFFAIVIFVSTPISYINIILANIDTKYFQFFLKNPFNVNTQYCVQYFLPFVITIITYNHLIKDYMPENLFEFSIVYILLLILSSVYIRISLTPIISVKKLSETKNYHKDLFSSENLHLSSWKLTKGNFLKISMVMILANLPVSIVLIFRWFYLNLQTNSENLIDGPYPHSLLIGGDTFVAYAGGFLEYDYFLNIITFIALLWSILISIAVRICLLDKLSYTSDFTSKKKR